MVLTAFNVAAYLFILVSISSADNLHSCKNSICSETLYLATTVRNSRSHPQLSSGFLTYNRGATVTVTAVNLPGEYSDVVYGHMNNIYGFLYKDTLRKGRTFYKDGDLKHSLPNNLRAKLGLEEEEMTPEFVSEPVEEEGVLSKIAREATDDQEQLPPTNDESIDETANVEESVQTEAAAGEQLPSSEQQQDTDVDDGPEAADKFVDNENEQQPVIMEQEQPDNVAAGEGEDEEQQQQEGGSEEDDGSNNDGSEELRFTQYSDDSVSSSSGESGSSIEEQQQDDSEETGQDTEPEQPVVDKDSLDADALVDNTILPHQHQPLYNADNADADHDVAADAQNFDNGEEKKEANAQEDKEQHQAAEDSPNQMHVDDASEQADQQEQQHVDSENHDHQDSEEAMQDNAHDNNRVMEENDVKIDDASSEEQPSTNDGDGAMKDGEAIEHNAEEQDKATAEDIDADVFGDSHHVDSEVADIERDEQTINENIEDDNDDDMYQEIVNNGVTTTIIAGTTIISDAADEGVAVPPIQDTQPGDEDPSVLHASIDPTPVNAMPATAQAAADTATGGSDDGGDAVPPADILTTDQLTQPTPALHLDDTHHTATVISDSLPQQGHVHVDDPYATNDYATRRTLEVLSEEQDNPQQQQQHVDSDEERGSDEPAVEAAEGDEEHKQEEQTDDEVQAQQEQNEQKNNNDSQEETGGDMEEDGKKMDSIDSEEKESEHEAEGSDAAGNFEDEEEKDTEVNQQYEEGDTQQEDEGFVDGVEEEETQQEDEGFVDGAEEEEKKEVEQDVEQATVEEPTHDWAETLEREIREDELVREGIEFGSGDSHMDHSSSSNSGARVGEHIHVDEETTGYSIDGTNMQGDGSKNVGDEYGDEWAKVHAGEYDGTPTPDPGPADTPPTPTPPTPTPSSTTQQPFLLSLLANARDAIYSVMSAVYVVCPYPISTYIDSDPYSLGLTAEGTLFLTLTIATVIPIVLMNLIKPSTNLAVAEKYKRAMDAMTKENSLLKAELATAGEQSTKLRGATHDVTQRNQELKAKEKIIGELRAEIQALKENEASIEQHRSDLIAQGLVKDTQLQDMLARLQQAENQLPQIASQHQQLVVLHNQIQELEQTISKHEGDIKEKDTKIEELTSAITAHEQLQHEDGTPVSVEELVTAGQAQVQLDVQKKLIEELLTEKDQNTVQIAELKGELEVATTENEKYKTKFLESETKLKVLSEFYESKEKALQQQLGERRLSENQSTLYKEKVIEEAKILQEELKASRQKVSELEKEITNVEHSSRLDLAKHEKKAHENWLSSRKFERKVKDLEDENSALRDRIAKLEDLPPREFTPDMHPSFGEGHNSYAPPPPPMRAPFPPPRFLPPRGPSPPLSQDGRGPPPPPMPMGPLMPLPGGPGGPLPPIMMGPGGPGGPPPPIRGGPPPPRYMTPLPRHPSSRGPPPPPHHLDQQSPPPFHPHSAHPPMPQQDFHRGPRTSTPNSHASLDP